MDLGGTWRAVVADDRLRRDHPATRFNDAGWEPIEVPGHWRSTPAFSDTDGPLLYRRRFEHERARPGRRHWLVLDGLFYQGDVWLDGCYLGDTEGYFFPHSFEVTDQLTAREEHVVAVEATCIRPPDLTAKRYLTGVFQHWDCRDSEWNPGGIWRPVRLEESGPVRLAGLQVVCTEATAAQAGLRLVAWLDTEEARTVGLRTTIDATEHERCQPLAAGLNRVEWTASVTRPNRWWPWALGEPHLVDVAVEVLVDGQEGPSDRRALRTGLRTITRDGWLFSVNGERLFLKGSNQGPTRMALGEATPGELAGDVDLAVGAGLDLLRIHGHVTRPELYDAADKAGLLLWQDMPLQWGYARGTERSACRQASAAVQMLGHHPSILLWCGHNEPIKIAPELGPRRLARRVMAAHLLPSWNTRVLDRSVQQALDGADGTRPALAHSGVGGGDSHLYLGWYGGDAQWFPRLCAWFPRLARFVSEFGAQAVPEDAAFCEPERWPDLDWEWLGARHALQKWCFDRYVPPADHPSFDSWRTATQQYQAGIIKHHVETLRRLKYRPAGGFAHFSLADGLPAVTWSVLGHDRQAKPGYRALVDACQPVIVVADQLPPVVRPGAPLPVDIHVVSDRRDHLDRAVVTARLEWTGGHHTWRWTGSIPPDSCVRVRTIQAVAPSEPGPLTLDLTLDGPVKATNRYTSVVGLPDHR